MARLELRLGDADRARYGGPEWLPFDVDQVMDTPADRLEDIEDEIGRSMEHIIDEMGRETARARRACAWLALAQSGVNVPWAEFVPATMRIRTRAVPDGDGDVDPPVLSSSDGSGLDSPSDPVLSPPATT